MTIEAWEECTTDKQIHNESRYDTVLRISSLKSVPVDFYLLTGKHVLSRVALVI